MLTYKEAYNKIIDAYFKDEIEPYITKFCFCGTLSPNGNWGFQFDDTIIYPYLITEYRKMEYALLHTINISLTDCINVIAEQKKEDPLYEDALFKGMCAALEVLKSIHRERGENVDDCEFEFNKRQLEKVI